MKLNPKMTKKARFINLKYLLMVVFASLMITCTTDDDSSETDDLVGSPGNPRFNLQFSNSDSVDLDLYVKTPNGETVYYGNAFADGGTLDVDCLCSSCPQGPNENIYWESGSAPEGNYEYWVKYFGSCSGSDASSNFTLRVLKNSDVIATQTGTLSGGQSSVFIHNQD